MYIAHLIIILNIITLKKYKNYNDINKSFSLFIEMLQIVLKEMYRFNIYKRYVPNNDNQDEFTYCIQNYLTIY